LAGESARRKRLPHNERRKTLSASVLDADWMVTGSKARTLLLVAESVFVYLKEQEVKTALAQIAENFPGVNIAFHTISHKALEGANKDHARREPLKSHGLPGA
jgi:O-methyltransferase involved in polyketide biosynthesis